MKNVGIVIALLLVAGIGSVGTFAYLESQDVKATSYESHIVYNYLIATNASPELLAKFNDINNVQPPSKKELAILMLDSVETNMTKLNNIPKL